jgi:cobalt-zinc-cadmium efflux system outer membrane protein
MTGRGSGARRLSIAAAVAVAFWGCSSYQPAPLPDLEAVAEASSLEAASQRAEELAASNPLLREIRIDLSDGLSPEEAGTLATALNPDLQALRRQSAEAEADLLAARILPNPEISGEASDPHGAGSAGLTTAYNLVVSLSTRTLLTRAARVGAARAGLQEVDLGNAWQEWQVAQKARLEALRLAWLRHRLAIASEELGLETAAAELLEGALASGDTTLTQVGVQRAALEKVRAAVAELEQAEAQSRGALAALLGDADLTGVELVRAPLPSTFAPRESVAAVLPRCLGNRLDLAALRQGYRAQELRLRQAILEQIPDVTVGFIASRDEARLKFLGGMVSVGVPVFDRNQGRVARERATRDRLAAEYRARALAVRATLHGILEMLAVIEKRLPELRDSIQPLAEIEAAEREAALRDDVDRLSYQTVRLALLDQRLLIASLSQARQEAVIGLDTACGGAVQPRSSTGGSP